jgi:RimJ/RimL family protein N-acetyltransferase
VRARHPGLRTVQTVNAADNPHMGAINEALGFRVVDRLVEWQLPLRAA